MHVVEVSPVVVMIAEHSATVLTGHTTRLGMNCLDVLGQLLLVTERLGA